MKDHAAFEDFFNGYITTALWSTGITTYRMRYEHCDTQWTEEWSSACNDKCPVCDKEIEPAEVEELDGNLDDFYGTTDIDTQVLRLLKDDCKVFFDQAELLIAEELLKQYEDGKELTANESGSLIPGTVRERTYATAGHDFWLTQNGHGAGFWDGDWPIHGEKLTELSKQFPEIDLYVGDDGKIYK